MHSSITSSWGTKGEEKGKERKEGRKVPGVEDEAKGGSDAWRLGASIREYGNGNVDLRQRDTSSLTR